MESQKMKEGLETVQNYISCRLFVNRKYFHVPRDIFEPKVALGFDEDMVIYPVRR